MEETPENSKEPIGGFEVRFVPNTASGSGFNGRIAAIFPAGKGSEGWCRYEKLNRPGIHSAQNRSKPSTPSREKRPDTIHTNYEDTENLLNNKENPPLIKGWLHFKQSHAQLFLGTGHFRRQLSQPSCFLINSRIDTYKMS